MSGRALKERAISAARAELAGWAGLLGLDGIRLGEPRIAVVQDDAEALEWELQVEVIASGLVQDEVEIPLVWNGGAFFRVSEIRQLIREMMSDLLATLASESGRRGRHAPG